MSRAHPCGSDIALNWNKEYNLMFENLFLRISVFYFVKKRALLYQLHIKFFLLESNDPLKVITPKSNKLKRLLIPKVTRVITSKVHNMIKMCVCVCVSRVSSSDSSPDLLIIKIPWSKIMLSQDKGVLSIVQLSVVNHAY